MGASSSSQQRYTKIKCIGAGSFGSVFLYDDNKTNKFVAVKEIFTGNGDFEQVKKEKSILEKLNSPHIVRLIDHFENKQENMYRLVMEYCSGGSLKNKLFNDDKLLIIAEHILNGLAYMHKRGFIHRDIKPENILCCDGEKERVYKLGDLGSSKSIEHSVKTYTGSVKFMAPEVQKLEYSQLKSGQRYNNKVDIWSFGATLLYLGEGRQCKIESNPKFKRIKNEKLRKVIEKCLIIDPKQRSSVAALQRILVSEVNDDEKQEWNDGLMPINENRSFSSDLSVALETQTSNINLLKEMLNTNELIGYIAEKRIKQSIDLSMEYWDLLASSKSIIKLKQDQIDTLLEFCTEWNGIITKTRLNKCQMNENVFEHMKSICNKFKQWSKDEAKLEIIADKWNKQRMEHFRWEQEIQVAHQVFWEKQSKNIHKTDRIQKLSFKMSKMEDVFYAMCSDSCKISKLFDDFVCNMRCPKNNIEEINHMQQNILECNFRVLRINVKRIISSFQTSQRDCVGILDTIYKAQLRFNSRH